MKKNQKGSLIRKIIIATDFSPASTHAFRYAVDLAEQLSAEIIAVFVKDADDLAIAIRQNIPVRQSEVGKLKKKVEEVLRSQFESLIKNTKTNGSVRFTIAEGHPAEQVLKIARKENADLIVSGTRGHSLASSLLLGSTARELIIHSKCPVLTFNDRSKR
jgi:nucleotide-binding universal stress UspA family protein